jgi:hypothetical protein
MLLVSFLPSSDVLGIQTCGRKPQHDSLRETRGRSSAKDQKTRTRVERNLKRLPYRQPRRSTGGRREGPKKRNSEPDEVRDRADMNNCACQPLVGTGILDGEAIEMEIVGNRDGGQQQRRNAKQRTQSQPKLPAMRGRDGKPSQQRAGRDREPQKIQQQLHLADSVSHLQKALQATRVQTLLGVAMNSRQAAYSSLELGFLRCGKYRPRPSGE